MRTADFACSVVLPGLATLLLIGCVQWVYLDVTQKLFAGVYKTALMYLLRSKQAGFTVILASS